MVVAVSRGAIGVVFGGRAAGFGGHVEERGGGGARLSRVEGRRLAQAGWRVSCLLFSPKSIGL